MESILHMVAGYLVRQSWQLAVVFGIVLVASWGLRRASAHWRYLLWLVVVAKCLTPPLFSVPVAVLPQRSEIGTERNAPDAPAGADISGSKPSPENWRAGVSQRLDHPASVSTRPTLRAANTAGREHFNVRGGLVVGWMLVVGLIAAFVGRKAWATHWRLRQTRLPADKEVYGMAAALAKRFGMRSVPTIYVARVVAQPFVWGWVRGDIYVPLDFAKASSAEQREAILIHELAHVARWDVAASNIQVVAQMIFFFHPLVWWTNKKIRQEREKCCDEIVLAGSRTRPQVYCEAIVHMLTLEHQARHASPGLAVTGSTRNIEERIVTMLTPGRKFSRSPSVAAIVTMFFVAACVLPTALVLTSQADPASSDTPSKNAESASGPSKTSGWTPGQLIEVRVINAETREAIPGVKLELQNQGAGINFEDVKVETTDADGRSVLKLTDLPAEAVRIYPSKPGFVPLRVYWAGQPSPVMPKSVTIPIEPGKAFGGTIRNEAGEPIPDVKVTIDYWATGSGENPHIRANVNTTAKSDKDGRWQVNIMPAVVEAKELHIYLDHADYISDHLRRGFAPTPVTEQPPMEKLFDRTAEMVMKKGYTIEGQVADGNGQPITKARIYTGEYYWFEPKTPRSETNKEGRFRISGLKPAGADQTPYNIDAETGFTVEAPGYAPELIVDVRNNDSPIRVRLEPGRTIQGQVVDSFGNPVQGAIISAGTWRGHRNRLHLEAKSDAEGNFTVADAPADEVKFDVRKEGYMMVEDLPMSPSGEKYSVTLQAPLKIVGSVRDAETGKPLEKFSLIEGSGYEDGRAPEWMGATAKTISDGRYSVTIVQERFPRLVRVEADGYMPAESRVFRPYDPDKGEITYDFKLRKAAPMTGIVLGLDGKPLAGADVYLATNEMAITDRKVTYFGQTNRKMTFYVNNTTTKTDHDGRFKFAPEPEPFCLVVVHERGVAMLTEEEFKSSEPISIEEWSNQNQTLRIVRKPANGQTGAPNQFP